MSPVPHMGDGGSRTAIPAVEPSTRFAARVAAGIFAGLAVVLTAVVLLPSPHSFGLDRLIIPAVCAAVALLLHLLAGRLGQRALELVAALGTLLVSIHIALWSSDAALSGEMLYLWLGLYVAYFFPARVAAVQLGFMAVCYLVVLLESAPADAVVGSWVMLVAVLFPAAAVLRMVRDGVTKLVKRLSQAARTDPLTGLMNRLAIDGELAEELERAVRADQSLSVVIGDLDHFKSVNDRLGHRAGDDALVRVGAILERHRRAGDSIGRTGGEEFTIVLPGAGEHDSYLVAERLRASVEAEFEGDPAALTFSFGVATFPSHGRSADAVIEAADQALYAAKALGRNRCVIFSSEIAAIFGPETGRDGEEPELATLLSLAEALDLRDTGTANHSRTVGLYCRLLARELRLSPEHARRVGVAGILHDIGKIGLPEAILKKPGKLAPVELAEIRTHPEIGAQLLRGRGLEDLREWVLCHHERPDGQGYPRGLKAAEIPLEAKILAVGDAYEAMTADRVYRSSLGERAARGELLRCAGTQFDSRVVAAFLAVLKRLDKERASGRIQAAG